MLKPVGKLPSSGGRPHTPGQMLRLSCPGGHTSCCIYVLLKALLCLLSYEERCTETGAEAKPQRTCLAWQHCPELSPLARSSQGSYLQSHEGQGGLLSQDRACVFPSATLPLVAFSGLALRPTRSFSKYLQPGKELPSALLPRLGEQICLYPGRVSADCVG